MIKRPSYTGGAKAQPIAVHGRWQSQRYSSWTLGRTSSKTAPPKRPLWGDF